VERVARVVLWPVQALRFEPQAAPPREAPRAPPRPPLVGGPGASESSSSTTRRSKRSRGRPALARARAGHGDGWFREVAYGGQLQVGGVGPGDSASPGVVRARRPPSAPRRPGSRRRTSRSSRGIHLVQDPSSAPCRSRPGDPRARPASGDLARGSPHPPPNLHRLGQGAAASSPTRCSASRSIRTRAASSGGARRGRLAEKADDSAGEHEGEDARDPPDAPPRGGSRGCAVDARSRWAW
jgi:hypothetical protein